MIKRLTLCVVFAVFAVLALQPTMAVAQDGSFSCRASAARAIIATPLPGLTLEPFVANAPDAPCVTDSAEVLSPTTVGPVTAAAVYAGTQLTAGKDARSQAAVASAAVAAAPAVAIAAEVLNAAARYECVNGQPRSSSSSQVVGLTINGTAVNVPDGPLTIDLGPVGVLHLNQTVSEPNRVTQRAFYLDTALLDVVIAEAIADISGNPCAQAAAPTAPAGTPLSAPPASRFVLGQRRAPSSAALAAQPSAVDRKIAAFGTTRCIQNSFLAAVRGRNIARVTFAVDGRRLKVDRTAQFDARIRGKAGIRRITARVVFLASTRAAPRTLRLTFRRCAAAVRFTG